MLLKPIYKKDREMGNISPLDKLTAPDSELTSKVEGLRGACEELYKVASALEKQGHGSLSDGLREISRALTARGPHEGPSVANPKWVQELAERMTRPGRDVA